MTDVSLTQLIIGGAQLVALGAAFGFLRSEQGSQKARLERIERSLGNGAAGDFVRRRECTLIQQRDAAIAAAVAKGLETQEDEAQRRLRDLENRYLGYEENK